MLVADGALAQGYSDVLQNVPLPDTYLESMSEARRAADEQRWAAASDLYGHAHALRPTSDALIGVMQSAAELGDHLKALQVARRLMETFGGRLSAAQRDTVAHVQRTAQAQVATLTFRIEPAGEATLYLDGKVTEYLGAGPLHRYPGPLAYEVEALDYQRVEGKLQLRAGEQRTLRVRLEPTTNTGAASMRLLDVALPPREQGGAEGGLYWTWWALGGSALMFTSSVVFYYLGEAELDDLLSQCEAARCFTADAQAALDDSPGETYEVMTNVTLGVGIVAAVAGVVLMVVEWPSDPDGHARMRPIPGGGALRWSF